MNVQVKITDENSLRVGLSRAMLGVLNRKNIPHNTLAVIGTYDALVTVIETKMVVAKGDILQIAFDYENSGLKNIQITQLSVKQELNLEGLKLSAEALSKLVEITEKSSNADKDTKEK